MECRQTQLAAYDGPEPADDLRVGGACFCRWGETWYGAKILSLDGDSHRVQRYVCNTRVVHEVSVSRLVTGEHGSAG